MNAHDLAAARRVTDLFLRPAAEGKSVFTRADIADINRMTAILWWEAMKAKFDPGQPRVPAGSSGGGQWTSDGGGGGGGSAGDHPAPGVFDRLFGVTPAYGDTLPRENNISSKLHVDNATQYLVAHRSANQFGDSNCAHAVIQAIKKGGGITVRDSDLPALDTNTRKREAKDYGHTLKKIGFGIVAQGSRGEGYPPRSYIPKKGDVVIISTIPKHHAGHMAMYTGKKHGWVSDFIQPRGIWPAYAYQEAKPSYVIYRHQERIGDSSGE